eukprot:1189307-Prorocentrum_minimum.AAC.2
MKTEAIHVTARDKRVTERKRDAIVGGHHVLLTTGSKPQRPYSRLRGVALHLSDSGSAPKSLAAGRLAEMGADLERAEAAAANQKAELEDLQEEHQSERARAQDVARRLAEAECCCEKYLICFANVTKLFSYGTPRLNCPSPRPRSE